MQEMANPLVRPHLHFYPEDSGSKLSEARQADRWLHELPSELTTPSARIRGVDYFIFEPAMLTDGQCCMPFRWFTRKNRAGTQDLFAKCWRMTVVSREGDSGWHVMEDETIEASHEDFLKNFEALKDDAAKYGVPHPSKILGTCQLLVESPRLAFTSG